MGRLFLDLKIFLKNIFLLNKFYILYNYFFFLKKKISYQLSSSRINFTKPNRKVIFFTLIETSHTVNFFLMLFAKILQIKGYNVYALVCDEFLGACEVKSIRSSQNINPCYECKFNQEKVYPFFKIKIINLSKFNSNELEIKIKEKLKQFKKNNYSFKKNDEFFYLNNAINDSVVRYYFGSHLKEKNNKIILKLKLDHCKTALYMSQICKIIDKEYKPTSVVSVMTSYSGWYPFFYYFKKSNRFRQVGFDTNICTFDNFKFFPSIRYFKKFLNSRKIAQLNKREKKDINNFLKIRFSSNNSVSNEKNKKIKEILNIQKKINIFIFPNVFWDVGLTDRGAVFNSVLDWLFFTLDVLKNNPKYHIYIKPHPAEFTANNSITGIEEVIKIKYGETISNLSFIENSKKFNSYDLKYFIDVALVFNGTLNLEFMLLDVPVISTGISSTSGAGLVKEVKSLKEYKKILTDQNYDFKKFLVKDKKKLISFAYFWFIKRNLSWSKNNFYTHSFGRFKGFNFKSLDYCNFNDKQTKSIVNFILEGKQLF